MDGIIYQCSNLRFYLLVKGVPGDIDVLSRWDLLSEAAVVKQFPAN